MPACVRCGYERESTQNAAKYCNACRADAWREVARDRMRRKRTGKNLSLRAYAETVEAVARKLGIDGKWCCKCGEVKPTDRFSTRPNKAGQQKPKSWCKACITAAAANAGRRKQNP